VIQSHSHVVECPSDDAIVAHRLYANTYNIMHWWALLCGFVANQREDNSAKGDIEEMQATTIGSASKPIVQRTKPFTQAEQLARENGRRYLQLAKSYVQRGDLENAVSCCLEGLWGTLGVSRPLAIRDQLQDILDAIDPMGETASRIQSAATGCGQIAS
jgi:hypothetical protein